MPVVGEKERIVPVGDLIRRVCPSFVSLDSAGKPRPGQPILNLSQGVYVGATPCGADDKRINPKIVEYGIPEKHMGAVNDNVGGSIGVRVECEGCTLHNRFRRVVMGPIMPKQS